MHAPTDLPGQVRSRRRDTLGVRGTTWLGALAAVLAPLLLAVATAVSWPPEGSETEDTGDGSSAATRLLLCAACAAAFAAAWAVRCLRNRAARRRADSDGSDATRMRMVVRGASYQGTNRTYVVLLPQDAEVTSPREDLLRYVDHARSLRWRAPGFADEQPQPLDQHLHQPVVFEPALDDLVAEVTDVVVHGDRRPSSWRGTRAVVELPDGRRLVPAGRLLARSPRTWLCRPRATVATDLLTDLQAAARAGDPAAAARLTALATCILKEEKADPLTLEPLGPRPRTPMTPLRELRALIIVGALAVQGLTSGSLLAAALTASAGPLIVVAAWAWHGGDPDHPFPT